MNQLTARPIHDRYDRHLRHVQLCVAPDVSEHRLVFAVEEGLRLISLPGEDRGRMYYFRRSRITGLPPDGNRAVWQARFQEMFELHARQAVYGADTSAGQADAVYFRSEQEALEILLHRLLAQKPSQEWFWPMVIDEHSATGQEQPSLLHVIERLRSQPASWVAFTTSLFATPNFDVLHLFRTIPAKVIEHWLAEMDSAPRHASLIPQLSADSACSSQPAIRHALQVFGPTNPGVVWLGTLAVLLDSPADLAAGIAVSKARAQLQQLALELKVLAAEESLGIKKIVTPNPQQETDIKAVIQGRQEEPIPLPTAKDANAPGTTQPSHVELSATPKHEAQAENTPPTSLEQTGEAQLSTTNTSQSQPTKLAPHIPPAPGNLQEPATIHPWQVSGLPTRAAGLFFLLNVMQQIGMAELISPLTSVSQFVPRVLLHLARQSGATADDSVVLWLHELMRDSPAAALPQLLEPSFWPGNLAPSTHTATVDDLVRIWSVAIRRWCWRFVKISTSQVVLRDGLFYVNRTDLDIALPIEAADVRIRKAGLDLNPGWLPWFGRVVRFHYLFPGEHHG